MSNKKTVKRAVRVLTARDLLKPTGGCGPGTRCGPPHKPHRPHKPDPLHGFVPTKR
jgi:hypothetical protein